jgi:hypothetical protein
MPVRNHSAGADSQTGNIVPVNRLAGIGGPSTNGHGASGNGKAHDYTRVFREFGVAFRGTNSSGEALADACPWCGKDKFYVNAAKGVYHCKHCDEKGNVTTYLTWLHREFLERTTNVHYIQLSRKRGGVAWQTFQSHGWAYDAPLDRWLIPFKNSKGNVVNLQQYYPNKATKPNKYLLPELPSALYGLGKLLDPKRQRCPVWLCEGPPDGVALDWNIGATNRAKYVIVATPGPFKAEWAGLFRGRKVRALFDNDQGGDQHRRQVQKLLGDSGVADELLLLKWPDGTPDGFDVNDLMTTQFKDGNSALGWLVKNCIKVIADSPLAWSHGWDRAANAAEEVIIWVWDCRLCCGTYASFSGRKGTLKSLLMREIVALYTQGKALPDCTEASLPPGHVVYVTAEDIVGKAWAELLRFGANKDLISVLPAVLKDGEQLNVLDQLPHLRQIVRQYGTKLVVIDGQNSVVGAPCIATDMLARVNITNKLHQFAQ